MPRKRIAIHGRVQGVGFRYFAREQAHSLGISGWVRNLPNGTVEVEAQGDQESLDSFLHILNRGPIMATVQHMEIEEMEETPTNPEFGVRF